MIRFLKPILILFIFVSLSQTVLAQNVNPATVDVSKLSDAQIQKVVDEMNKKGLGIEEAIMMARAKGASETQIAEMRRRIEALKWTSRGDSTQLKKLDEEAELESLNELSPKTELDEEIKKDLTKIFGFHFFNSEKLTFAPSVDVPVSDSYTLGIGDELVVNIYGASQQIYNLQVQSNGSVYITDLGPVQLAGLTFSKAQYKIKNRLMSIYSGLRGDKPNTFVDVSVGQLKAVKVNVIGEVNVPGTYTLPATASAFNALYLAGGPNEKGSFRQIDVLRDGNVISTIDVYAYLVDGKTLDNIQLRDQDVIMVRPYLNRVKVAGEFKRDGWFEAKKDESLADMFRYAGGFSENAYTHRVELYRNNTRTMTFKDVAAQDFGSTILMNGDSIVAGLVIDRFENKVSLEGAVYRPGNYEMTEGLMLSQLIDRAEGAKEEAYMDRGVIIRKKKDYTFESLSFSLRDVLNGKTDIALKKNDKIQISSIFDMREAQTVEIVGEVQFPGTYAYAENLKLADLIYMAGGFLEQAEVSAVEVSRILDKKEIESLTNRLSHSFQFPVDRQLKMADEDAAFVIKPFDKIYVRRAPGYRPQAVVKVQGEVAYAGDFGLTFKGEKISDVIKRAGGVTPEAFVEGASLRRKHEMSDAEYEAKLALAKQDTTMNEIDIKRITYQVVGIDLVKIFKKPGGVDDLQLQDGDQLLIPEKMQTVKVSGAVLSPVALTFKEKKSLRKYIRSSGGFAQSAKKSKVYVLYANGTAESTRGSIFGRRYPKVKPGCEIIVPEKPEVDKTAQAGKWLGITSAVVSMFTAISIAIK
ncbi:protein involved in polysaccharide export with SLBB domain [Ancylomarina subtilis]|uniref:Protein involved in polysaccharide export with SLBB domain n=1 Tax=Ancylomarina subtilis TaxID=1639035 RepID=A0A4Q7VK53_9BACT|nr:SLBB domain-containing protein [Ancylomarina subtilis]RZT96504.1 protein involved in polysaccharide export with SLBB domain [Ancylomarina subtilis]